MGVAAERAPTVVQVSEGESGVSQIVALPIEGAAALRQILGILDDHGMAADAERADDLDERLRLPWTEQEWARLEGAEHGIPMSREDAVMLVDGLRFTEVMSVELPFFDHVMLVSSWIIDRLDETFPGVAEGH